MAARLTPCPACSRHVRVGSAACPFCGGDVPLDVPLRTSAGKPLTRAAIMFAGATAVAGCSSSTTPSTSGGSSSETSAGSSAESSALAVHYGVFTSSFASTTESESSSESLGNVLYGPAMVHDAGVDGGS